MTLTERFLKYITIPSPSNTEQTKNNTQSKFANKLYEELNDLGLQTYYDKANCYVYGLLKGNIKAPSLGFISHMDTSLDASGNVKFSFKENYDGKDIILENGLTLSVKQNPDLKNHIGKTLIVTKGDSLLGADDKAGIAEIMTMLEEITKSDSAHGDIYVAFTPDEEIGKSMDHFDLTRFKADYAYTVDGSSLGEISYENFYAVDVFVRFTGINVHPGYAKDKMINPIILLNEFINKIPNERPENSDGYAGFYYLYNLSGDVSEIKLKILVRDFDKEKLENRINILKSISVGINQIYNNNLINIEVKERYKNMYEIIKDNMHMVDYATNAMKNLGIIPITKPARGGTDGARLSFMGIPCPNLGTGAHNFHSVYEYIAIEDMKQVKNILIGIVHEYSKVEMPEIEDVYKRVRK